MNIYNKLFFIFWDQFKQERQDGNMGENEYSK